MAYRGHGLVWSGSGYGQLGGSCESDDELSGFIQCGEFLD